MLKMTNFQKLIGLSVLITSLSLAYYLVIFISDKERQKQTRIENQIKLRDQCLDNADLRYRLEWAVKCKEEGLDALCTGLPGRIATPLGQRRDKNADNCFKLYLTK